MSPEPPPPDAPFLAYLAERNLVAARVAAVLVAVLMPAGVTLDLATHPEAVGAFLPLRFAGSAVALVALALTFSPWARRFPFGLGVLPVLACTIPIELMIEQLEGYASPYYAGLNLGILGVGMVFNWSTRQTIATCALVVGIWLFPALLLHPDLSLGPFINNLYFLVLTSVIAVASNTSRYRQQKREFDARAEVARTSGELSGALARLRELDRLKNEFFANISHELRTPLTLILAPVDDRLGQREPGSDGPLLEGIRRNAQRLLRLIDDLLDLSRIDAGRLRLSVAEVELGALTRNAVEAFRGAAEAKGIALLLVEGEPTSGIFGDAHRLEMVLTNLLGNALKFTPAGGRVQVGIEQDAAGARVVVSDTGPGISAADLPRIFERFHQLDGAATRGQGGVGIGLALARELAELHGGSLEATSTPGSGTTFSLVLPAGAGHVAPGLIERRRVVLPVGAARRAGDLPEPQPPAVGCPGPEGPGPPEDPIFLEGGRRPRLVVIEDQPELLELLRGLLAPSCDVLSATDGVEGLALVRRERPDLVLSDVMMPRLSGNELCSAIKHDPELRRIPVILLTARSGSEAVVEGYARGADDFVSKPFHPRILRARIRAQLRLRSLGLQLASQARLAAIGTLAAGVGHEIRNPVNAVVNGARALLEQPGHDEGARRLLEVIEDAGQRIDRISDALLAHASPGEGGAGRPCDVTEGLDSAVRLLAHRLGEITVHREYTTSARVIAPAGELNQVFLNLLDNAIRAPATNVWIRVAPAAAGLCVSIEDDGPGVPPEVASRIFDPFFTTREPGQGTGLGLYLSQEIVGRLGGQLRHEARQGGGAAFTLELPAEAQ